MIPNLKMGYYHQREYLEKPCSFQMNEKLNRKPMKDSMEGFEYTSLFASKTYSILSYIVGGFVGSKSQMNNNKHNLSYDLSAAIFNLLNPCKYEREKNSRKSNESFCNPATKLSSEGYDKYIVKSSHTEKMVNLGLNWWENYVFGFEAQCYTFNERKEVISCDDKKNSQSTMENKKSESSLSDSVDVTDRVSVCESESLEKECLNRCGSLSLKERFRLQSECSVESTDSESFIVFDGPNADEEKNAEENWRLENLDFDSEDDDDDDEEEEDDEDEDSCCDEYDVYSDKEIAEANEKWLRNYKNVETGDEEDRRKVRFNDDVKINKIVAWDFAYRAARTGPWEQMARDRVRFHERILRLSHTISPVLRREHRDKIYKKLYS